MGTIIGISGKIGSGKSTAAKYLIEYLSEFHAYSYEEKFYAYNLKLIISIITGLPMEVMLSQSGKNIKLSMYDGITVGELQQKIGTEMFRNLLDDEVWIKSMFAPYTDECDWIISDVRFINEAEKIREKGGILIRLNGDPAGDRANSKRDLNHQSEIELDDYPYFNVIVQTEKGDEKLKLLSQCIASMLLDIEKNGSNVQKLTYNF